MQQEALHVDMQLVMQLKAKVRHGKETIAQLEQALNAIAATNHLKMNLHSIDSSRPTEMQCQTVCEPDLSLRRALVSNAGTPLQCSGHFADKACASPLDAASQPLRCGSQLSFASVSGPIAQECRTKEQHTREPRMGTDSEVLQASTAESIGNKNHQQGAQCSLVSDKGLKDSNVQVRIHRSSKAHPMRIKLQASMNCMPIIHVLEEMIGFILQLSCRSFCHYCCHQGNSILVSHRFEADMCNVSASCFSDQAENPIVMFPLFTGVY
jgi:hypothetical protein